MEGKTVDEQFADKILAALKGQNQKTPMSKWKPMRVGNVVSKSVLLTFVVDKEMFVILEEKCIKLMFVRNKLTEVTSEEGW